MLETTATVQAIVYSSAQVQTMLLGLAAQARADARHALRFRLLLLVAFVLDGAERLGRCWRWSRGLL